MSETDTAASLQSDALRLGIEEIAEDMLHLLQRLGGIEQRQAEFAFRVEQLERAGHDASLAQARALEALRRDLLGERKALATRGTFDAVAPVLDSLGSLRRSLDPGADGQLFAQVNGVVSALAGLLQGLGFHDFAPEVGEPFDPSRMECVGYAPGTPGVVLAGVHPGYRADDVVVRPAGVLIADPTRTGEEGDDEAPDLEPDLEPDIEREEP